jgi:hypothetical protein
MAGDGSNGSAAFSAADEVDRGLDLRREGGSALGLDPARKKAFHRGELPLYRMLISDDVLDVLDLLTGQNVLERERSIVKKVGTIMQDGRRPHLGKANDDEGGVRRVLNHAGSLLQTGHDGARKEFAVEGCAAGLS